MSVYRCSRFINIKAMEPGQLREMTRRQFEEEVNM